jgi:prepilin-type N-terminal cleavage/methylation domain-containing protein
MHDSRPPLTTHMKPTLPKRAFTLVEMLLVIAIISILAAMAISNFSNASQDTRAVVARQQLAVVQEAVNHWANKEIGKVTTSGGTGRTVAQVMAQYNGAADAQTRFNLFKGYLDDAAVDTTRGGLGVDNTTGRVTSEVMRDVGMYLLLPDWGGNSYPKVQLLP